MKILCRLSQQKIRRIHEQDRGDVGQNSKGLFLINPLSSLPSMVKYSLNTKDPAVRNMLIEEYDKLGIHDFERKWEISGRVAREWKRLKSTTGSTEPRYSHLGRPHSLSPTEKKRMEKF